MKSGQQLTSTVCSTKVVVVRMPATDAILSCGGQPMVEAGSPAPGHSSLRAPELFQGSSLGKRYSDPVTGLQVLCVSPGEGSLTCDGNPLVIEGAKPLPSSD